MQTDGAKPTPNTFAIFAFFAAKPLKETGHLVNVRGRTTNDKGQTMRQRARSDCRDSPVFVVARHSPAPAGVGLPEREMHLRRSRQVPRRAKRGALRSKVARGCARTPKGPQGAERSPLSPSQHLCELCVLCGERN